MDRCTSHIGPLGSSIHVLRADAETVGALAGMEWNEHFRRVGLDPVRGLVTLMSPSHLHEELSKVLGSINRVRHGLTRAERSEAVTRELRKHCALRIREQQAAYADQK